MRATLRKSDILRGRKNFQEVFGSGIKYSSPLVSCLVKEKPPPLREVHPGIRVGFVVRRSVRRAVDRNRIKRLLREAYRRNKILAVNPAGHPRTFRDLIFIYSPNTARPIRSITYQEIEDCVKRILSSIDWAE